MNTYYSELGRKFEGRTPIDTEGYYVLHRNEEISRSLTVPKGVPMITAARFVQALADGCGTIIRAFARRPENKDVYAFSLYADDHSGFLVYMNTEAGFQTALAAYGHDDPERIRALKYGQGDFEFQFRSEQMGEHGETIRLMERAAYRALDLNEDSDSGKDVSEPVAAIEAGIVDMGYQVLALRAVQRLIEDDAFAPLRTTADFIAYAATENDYFNYSIVMRKTIEPALFDALFPELGEYDRQYRRELESYRKLTVAEALDYWTEAADGSITASPYRYIKSEYEVFAQLAPFGSTLAEASLPRLRRVAEQDDLVQDDRKKLFYYMECLHFCGGLTDGQREECRSIAALLEAKHGELREEARQLVRLANGEAS